MTKEQLERFIAIRNKSGFASNLQFSIDADEAGFKVAELGTPTKVGLKQAPAYHWETPHGTLIEEPGGRMSLRSK
jgi:hypothetical protein